MDIYECNYNGKHIADVPAIIFENDNSSPDDGYFSSEISKISLNLDDYSETKSKIIWSIALEEFGNNLI